MWKISNYSVLLKVELNKKGKVNSFMELCREVIGSSSTDICRRTSHGYSISSKKVTPDPNNIAFLVWEEQQIFKSLLCQIEINTF